MKEEYYLRNFTKILSKHSLQSKSSHKSKAIDKMWPKWCLTPLPHQFSHFEPQTIPQFDTNSWSPLRWPLRTKKKPHIIHNNNHLKVRLSLAQNLSSETKQKPKQNRPLMMAKNNEPPACRCSAVPFLWFCQITIAQR